MKQIQLWQAAKNMLGQRRSGQDSMIPDAVAAFNICVFEIIGYTGGGAIKGAWIASAGLSRSIVPNHCGVGDSGMLASSCFGHTLMTTSGLWRQWKTEAYMTDHLVISCHILSCSWDKLWPFCMQKIIKKAPPIHHPQNPRCCDQELFWRPLGICRPNPGASRHPVGREEVHLRPPWHGMTWLVDAIPIEKMMGKWWENDDQPVDLQGFPTCSDKPQPTHLMDNCKATLRGSKVPAIGSTPLSREDDVAHSIADHRTQRGSKIHFVANDDAKFHTKVGCEHGDILSRGCTSSMKPNRKKGYWETRAGASPRNWNRPSCCNIVIVDSQRTGIVHDSITPDADVLGRGQRVSHVMLVMYCKQSTINSKGNCLVENREISDTRKGPMKEGIRTSRARTPIIDSQHHKHLPFFGQTSHFHPPGSRFLIWTCQGCKGASFGEQILLLGRAGEDILHAIHFRKDLGTWLDYQHLGLKKIRAAQEAGILWPIHLYCTYHLVLRCLAWSCVKHVTCWFQFERQEQILTEEIPSISQYNCESSSEASHFQWKLCNQRIFMMQ